MKKGIVWVLIIFFVGRFILVLIDTQTTLTEFNFLTTCQEDSSLDQNANASHQRNWQSQHDNVDYCLAYQVTNKSNIEAHTFREQLKNPKAYSFASFWGEIYEQLIISDQNKLNHLIDSLSQQQEIMQQNKSELAHTLVSFVQDIPYSLVQDEPCKGKKNCIDNKKFGINSPVEFMYSLKGDCDTRTVFLYLLLKKFNIDAIIVNSKEYLHSMLAVNLIQTGEHLIHHGKKYYFWETTNKGWLPGMLPPRMPNKQYWKVALGDNFKFSNP